MNQSQRNFLIEKIEKTAKLKRKVLEDAMNSDEPPSLSMFLFHSVMSGNFQIKSNDEIREMIRQKALKGTDRDDWLGNGWGTGSKDKIFFKEF